MNPSAEIFRTLRSMRRRMMFRDFVFRTVRAALFFQGVVLVLTATRWWMGGFRPVLSEIPFVIGWPVAAGAVAGLVVALVRMPSLEHVAAAVDRTGGTRDRLLTGLILARKADLSEFESLALSETGRYVRGRDFRPLLPLRPPRELGWLLAPLVALALIWWDAVIAAADHDRRAGSQSAMVDGTTRGLDELARRLDSRADASDSPEIRKLAERLRRSAERTRAEAEAAGDAQKAALRELALLEQWVKELRQPGAASAEELNALAEALLKHEATRPAAQDLLRGNLAGASRELRKAGGDTAEMSEADVRKTIEQALDQLAARREQVSKAIEKLREQAKAGENERENLLEQIAELLEEQQQHENLARGEKGNKPGQLGGGKPLTDEELKKLLGALQELKNQQQGGELFGTDVQPGDADAGQRIAMLNFGQSRKADEKPESGPNFPSGLPGTDKDEGTTATPFGKKAADPGEAATQDRLSSRLGEGESLSAAMPGVASGGGRAARRYKELYEAASADAEDAVAQENIPLGSRLLIKRYFEAIRPRQ
jgi:hypothetical protein